MTTGPAPVRPAVIQAVLMLVSSLAIFSTDLYAPSLPHLAIEFGVDISLVQLTISLNLAAFAAAQLVYGPLADRFGRRPVMIGALAAFLFASLGCALVPSIEVLLIFRILQGLTIAAEAVIVLAVIRDLWDEVSGAKVLALYGMVVSVAPALGPVLGGYIHVWFGWRMNFWLLAVIAAALVILTWRLLPETAVPDREALRPRRIAREFGALLTSRAFMSYAIITATLNTVIYAFVTEAPFILIDRFGVAIEKFGFFQMAMVVAYFCGSTLARQRVDRWGLHRMLNTGLVVLTISAVVHPLAIVTGWDNPIGFTAPLCIYTFGVGMVFSAASMLALSAATGGTGAASALFSGIEMAAGSLGGFMVLLLHDGSSWPMAWVLGASVAVAILAARAAKSAARR